MLSCQIESEIETEHKVFRDFNMRQTVCLIIGGFIALCMYLYFRDVMLMVVFSLPFACVLALISRKDDNGRPFEEVFLKKLQKLYFKDDFRVARTKNGYVRLLNDEYQRIRAADSKNKVVVKAARNRRKAVRRKVKSSRMKALR